MLIGFTTKILLTGGTGFIGKSLVERLKNKYILSLYKRNDNLEQLVSTFRPDIIIHSAAEIYDESRMFDSNIKLTYNLLKLAEYIDVKKFIYIGSSSEYGRYNRATKESDRLIPATLYEATKGAGSLLVEASKLPSLIIRPFSVYGPGEPEKRFIPKLYNALKTNTQITIYPGVHDFIYIDDFLNILLSRMNINNKEIINAGTGIQYSNIEVANIIEEITGRRIQKNIAKTYQKTYDSEIWKNDTEYLKKIYNKTLISLRDGLIQYVNFKEKNS